MSFISSYLLDFLLLYFYFPSVISNPLPYCAFVPSFNFVLAHFFLFLVHIVILPAAFFFKRLLLSFYFFLVYLSIDCCIIFHILLFFIFSAY